MIVFFVVKVIKRNERVFFLREKERKKGKSFLKKRIYNNKKRGVYISK